jgi:hypothetical protein
MNIQITLHDGTTITGNMNNFNAAELATKMNDQKILMITVGDIIVNKNHVESMGLMDAPDTEGMIGIQILTDKGKVYTTALEAYNANDFSGIMNDQRLAFVSIGYTLLNKNIIKLVGPAAK